VPEVWMPELIALGSVIAIDIVLAGDNALVVGMAAANVDTSYRRRVIVFGIAAALILRVVFALAAVELLHIIGLMLVGGLLLLWVAWKLFLETREFPTSQAAAVAYLEGGADGGGEDPAAVPVKPKSAAVAIWQITVADVSMSLDNVLGVAGAAHAHPYIMAFGLIFSMTVMGVAANLFAGLFVRFPWLCYAGVTVIAIVAINMIYTGSNDVYLAVAAMY